MSSYTDTKNTPRTTNATETVDPKEAPIKVDGFGQVIALLEVADSSFRESLINRIAAKDPQLARQIRATLSRN